MEIQGPKVSPKPLNLKNDQRQGQPPKESVLKVTFLPNVRLPIFMVYYLFNMCIP